MRFQRLLIGLTILGALAQGGAALAADLGSGRLLVAGTRLTISPESQTVPFDTPTIVETHLVGFDPALGTLPSDLRVLADFTGPEISGVLVLETRPNEPFRIPRLSLRGDYQLDNIRLLQGDELLGYAEPRSAAVLVTEVLVTRVESRALTLDEIRSYGIVVDPSRMQAFNFTFAFAVGGDVFDYEFPIAYVLPSPENPFGRVEALAFAVPSSRSSGTVSQRFQPPQLAPFTLQLKPTGGGGGDLPNGGCIDPDGDCMFNTSIPLPGVILFPTDVSLLHQFFSVVLFAKNDSPAGDPLVIRDLTARAILPPGLRQAETTPPTPLGVPVPVRVPGADGKLGTADDITFMVAQSTGQAEVLVEGVQEGTHIVDFELEGVLEGMPTGVQRLTGRARGAVVVRDPTLSVTISHPDVVRADDEYSLLLTVTNTGAAPVNLLSFTLPLSGLSGVEVVGSNQRSIDTLLAGEAKVVDFRLRSLRTGRVVASAVRSGSVVSPQFEFRVGIGDGDIPLSPTSIVLPRSTQELPPELTRSALGLLGLGFSLATMPAGTAAGDLPRVGRQQVDDHAYSLAQAGRHVALGEPTFDAVALLAAEWTGARDGDWEWDRLRRSTRTGAEVGAKFAAVLATEVAASSPAAVHRRLAADVAPLRVVSALVVGNGASLEVGSRASGRQLRGIAGATGALRDLPFADLLSLGTSQLALLTRPEETGYQLRVRSTGGACDLQVVYIGANNQPAVATWSNVSLAAAGTAVVDVLTGAPPSVLYVDHGGDGIVDEQLPASLSTLTPRTFRAIAAVQNPDLDPSGHIVEVLFSEDIDLTSLLPRDPGRFEIPGKVSNGGLVAQEEHIAHIFAGEGPIHSNPFVGMRNSRVVRVVFDNPISPYVESTLTVRNVRSASGQQAATVALPVVANTVQPGAIVEGTVYGPDGSPAPFAQVGVIETDGDLLGLVSCDPHLTATMQADSQGRFRFDYVRQRPCGDTFTLKAQDPVSGYFGTALGRVRFVGQVQRLDIVMLGRGTIRGTVTYEDGSVPSSVRVLANSPVFAEAKQARVDAQGHYEVGDVPVGTVTLLASDRDGNFVLQTVEIPRAGAVTERNLVIVRRPPEEQTGTGQVRGIVVKTDGTTPVADAYVALQIDGVLHGVARSAFDGRFDFGTVPAGRADIEAFDGVTGLAGAQVVFDVHADQVNDVRILLRDDRGTIEGYVYRRSGATTTPVAGAVVWASGTPFNTRTDAAGFYRLEGVFAGDRTITAADLVNNVQTSSPVSLTGNGGVVRRDLYFLEETIRGGIAGEVLNFDGTPVSGATVHLAAGAFNWFHEAHTDSTGRFTIPDLGPGSYSVHAYKGAGGASKVASIRWDGETAWASLRFKKGTVRGVVRARNGSADPVGVRALVVYRTTVEAYGLIGIDPQPHTLETNGDGTFEIPNVLAGSYTMTIVNALYGERHLSGEIVFNGEVDEHEVLFETNGEIRGVVLDHDGVTPVAGVKVDLRHPALAVYDVHTDAQGAFRFPLVPPTGGNFPIDALYEHGSLFRQARVWVQLNRYGQELDVRIVLQKQGTVSGWVEDSNGDPVPGAVVTLKEEAFPHRQMVHNADGSGYYSFTNIFAGRVTVSAKAPTLGGLGGKTTAEVTTEGEEVFTLITLEATGEVEGRVLSPVDGTPVANAEVKLYRWGGFFDSATSDATGSFRFRLLPLATYEVWAFDPRTGRFGRRTGYVVNGNAVVASNDVTLEVRGEVDGHVLEPRNGAGIAGATVQLSTQSLVQFTTYSSSDVNGYFEFFGIPEGGFSLYTREPGGRRQARASGRIDEEGERVTVDLTLERMGRVVGRVLNPAGAPAGNFPNANTLISQDGQIVGATLDNPFAFDGLIAEHGFYLSAQEVGGSHRAQASGRIVDPTQDLQLDLQMVPIGSAQVAVRDSFGTLLPGAEVTLWSSGFYGWRQLSGSTGAQGTIRFDGIGAGNLSASARDPNTGLRGSASGSIGLEGQLTVLEVRLQDSGSIRGRVVMPDGVTPAVDALVVVNAAGKSLRATAGGDGAFELTAVPMGAFDVFAQQHLGAAFRQARGSLTSNGQVVDLGVLVLDDRDPYVVSFAPETGSRDLALTTVVTVRFSEPVDRTRFHGGWIAFRKLNGGGVGWNASWADGDATLVITPTAPLASFTGYEVIATTAAVDLAGRPMADPSRTVFYTRDVVAPTVIDVLPRDGQSQVALNANLQVTFSEPIELASLSGPAFQLTDLTTGAGVGTTFQQRPGRREVLLTPVGGLQTDRQYRLTVQGVRDDGGNVMTGVSTTTFWSVDTVPPVIVSVAPAAGTSFTAGDAIVFTIQATDARGLGKATVGVNGWEFSDPAAPYEVTALAPPVESVAGVDFTVTVYDAAGNHATLVRSLEVVPRTNGNAPRIEPLCLRDGDFVEPGQSVELAFAIADDEAVESATVRVDGQVLKAVSLVGTASSEVRVNWTPPANATPGTTFTAEVAVRDFARNVTTRTLHLAVPPEAILTGTRVIDASYAGRTLYLSRGTFLVREQVSLAGLNVLAGATVRGDHGLLDLRAAGPVRVQCRGSLDASATGYAGGDAANPVGRAPAGVRGSSPDAGGSHGGVGVAWGMAGPAGEVYDSVYEPSLGGGGASYAYSAAGRAGGGVIRIEAAALSLSGEVRARGGYEDGYSGGGGGTVVVHAATISGSGTIDASGADGHTCYGGARTGAGGGGRVALHGNLDGFDAALQVKAFGGKRYCGASDAVYAAPGTIYTRASGETYGALVVNAGKDSAGVERIGPATELPKLGSGAVASWAASGADALLSASPVFDGEWLGAWVVVLDVAGQELGAFRVAEVLADGRVRLAGAGTVSGAASYRGEYRFDRFTLINGAGVTALDRVWSGEVRTSGNVRLPAELGAGSVTVPAGSVVTPATGSSVSLKVSGTLTVESGARLDVSGFGYAGGTPTSVDGKAPAGVRGSSPDAGGSHGGVGVTWGLAGPAGEVYDSVYEPSQAGGGASFAYGGAGRPGGGVIRIEAGTLSLSGELRARGGYVDGYSGGGGGTVVVHAATFSGSGTIDASGADGHTCHGNTRTGGGGGGRVALHGDFAGFDAAAQVKAWGGKRFCGTSDMVYAAPGTIYTRASAEAYGRLLVDAGTESTGTQRVGLPTELPRLGSGSLAGTQVDGTGLWIERTGGFRVDWVGAWVYLSDASGARSGPFQVVRVDANGRALVASAASVNAVSYEGAYLFDSVSLRNGAGLTSQDPLTGQSVVFEGDAAVAGDVVASSVRVKAGSRVHPQSGSTLRFKVTGELVVEAGGLIDVSGYGYAAGTAASPDGKAPAGVRGSSPDAGGSHGGVGATWGGPGPAGDVYDSVYQPSLGGGGASHTYYAGGKAGGGVIEIDAGTLSLSGELRARGGFEDGYSGGGGGTVMVRAATISGSGTIDASGADGHTCYGNARTGGGGGGRVALHGDFADFDVAAQVKAFGGKRYCGTSDAVYAAPGTIYTRASAETYGALRVDAGKDSTGAERIGPATELPKLGSGAVANWAVSGADALLSASPVFDGEWLGAWVVVLDVAGQELGAFRVAEVLVDGRARLAGAGTVSGAASYRGEYRFDRFTLVNGAGVTALDRVWSGEVRTTGSARLPAELGAGSVTVPTGSVVTPATGSGVTLRVSDTLTIESGARLDVSGFGYAGGTSTSMDGKAPAGVRGSAPDAGGSHGGVGVTWGLAGPAGEVYDSVYEPSQAGGGASFAYGATGQAGGSVIRIETGTLSLSGELRARGGYEDGHSGGGGGTVIVHASTISGPGSIDASGADGHTCYGGSRTGGGGGGRVALHGNLSNFDPALQVKAWGGKRFCGTSDAVYAAPGTIYTRASAETYGALRVDAGKDTVGAERIGPATELPKLGEGAVANWSVSGADALLSASPAFDGEWLGAWVVLLDGAGQELGAFRVAEVLVDGRARLAGAGAVSGAASYRGEYRFDRFTLVNGAGVTALDRVWSGEVRTSGSARLPAELGAGSVTVPTGSVVTPATGSGVSLKVGGTLTVESGARLDVSGFGYAPGTSASPEGKAPAGVRGSAPDAGGSHGGVGVAWGTAGPAGEVYDSVYEPSLGGGGASHAYYAAGKAGGGVIRIEAGALSLSGELRARGGYEDGYSAGGGGTVIVHATTISGSGSVDASGADGHTCYGGSRTGGGGGGRVALHGNLGNFDPALQVKAWGGKRFCGNSDAVYAAPGTIYTRGSSDTYGKLLVTQPPPTSGPALLRTVLPAIGKGTIGSIASGTGGVWITSVAADAQFSVGVVGMWVRINGTDYKVLEQSADRRSLLLQAASGAFAAGDRYLGVYKFDSVAVKGGATLELRDGEVVGSFDVDSGATVVHFDLTPPAITVTQPAIGTVFRSGDTVAVAGTVTDNVAVTAVTFQFGEQSVTDTTSPYTWSVAAPAVETEGDIPLVVTATDAEANSTRIEHPVHVRPLAPSAPPAVSYTCPSTAALAVPGTQLEVFVSAAHDNGIEKVDFFLGAGETPAGTVFAAPYRYVFAIPAGAQEGTSVLLRARARSFAGTTAEATLSVPVVAGHVFTGTATIAATDTSHDGYTVVASTGTLSIAGTHTFRDLIVLDGATVNHAATTSTAEGRLELTLTRHLFVACGGAIDVSGRGYLGGNPRGYSYPNTTAEGAAASVGGSHGGRGGNFDGSGRTYDSVFDPRYPGAGGGGGSSKAGGGVVRIGAADMAIDGAIRASGDSTGSAAPFGAGGSIRLEASSIGGLGVVQANGGGSAASSSPAGGGGRIALLGGSVDAGLLSRVTATGGDGNTTARRGAAGTIFVKGIGDTFGQLIVDNRGIDSTQMTELPAVGTGILDAVTSSSMTDNEADFAHSLVGLDVFFNGNSGELWNVTGHAHHGTTLDLQVAGHALTAQAGNEYRGLYRFDRVSVRGKARVTTAERVTSTVAPEVESGAQWQPEYAATVAITAPAVGAHVTAGAAIGAAADATSNLGIASVTFDLAGTSVVDTTSPYSASFTAPAVATTTGFELKATARDFSGRKFVQTRTVFVDPSFDPNAPQVTLGACPADGDLVTAGSTHTISFTVTDNENVASYAVLVNDTAIAQNNAVNQPSTSSSVSWTVPAGAAAGSTYTVRVEGRDFSGGLGFAQVVLTVPVSAPLTGTQTLTAANNGQSLVLGAGTFTVTAPLSLANLTMLSGAVVKGTAGADLRIDVAGTARVQCGATLTGTALGYAGAATSSVKGGAPSGVLGSATDTGGSHGGPGAAHDGGIPGETYDSVYVPFLGGGGGSFENTSGGAGGGVVQLKAAELVLYGTISALGDKRGHGYPYRGGAGGGGSVVIETGTLRGKGLIDASGGNNESCDWWAGSGGGGRVAVYADTLSSFDPATQTKAWGGGIYYCASYAWRYAGAGTVFVKTASSTYGSLYVDSGVESNGTKRLGADVQLPVLGTGAVTAIEVSGSNLWVTQSTAFKPQWLGAWMVLVDGAGADLGGFRVQELSGNRVLLTGASAVSGAATFRGEYRFDAVTVRNGARVVTPDRMVALDFEAKSGEVWLPSKAVVRNLTIRNGATVMSAGEVLDLTVTEKLTIDSGGVLSVTGKGYPGATTASAQGGAPAGVTGSTSDTGGSHAGPGVAHDGGTAGAIYDSVYLPYQSGGGGSFENTPGGAGGGVLVAKVGELVLNGTIAARGDKRGNGYPNRGGAGAGGSIVIDAGIVRGSGTIDASGGDNESCDWWAGAGGGGRVALYAGSLVSFVPDTQIKSWGGGIYYCASYAWRYAGAGTVYVKTSSSTYGSLYIDSGAETNGVKRLGADVKLPDLGTGTVTAVEIAGADLWITQAASFKSAWLGARMVLIGAAGQELGSFPVLQVAANRVLLGGAGSTSGAASFRGEYRFDAVAVRNNARVVIPDAVKAADLEVRLGEVRLPARVEVTNMTVRNGATAQAVGDLDITVTDTLRVETGGTLSANSSGYPGAATSALKGGAPPGLLGSATDTGGSHGGPGVAHDGGIPGETYDSVYVPTLGGGGGSFENTAGGAGGGALRVRAATAIVDGVISSLGEKRGMVNTYRGGAGAGGSVVLEVGTLQGSGRIDASGGNNEACDWWAGAGGGGRVAVYADTLSFDPLTQMKAWAGGIYYCASYAWRYAGAGTVFVKSGTSTYGSLYVDSGLETNNTKRLGADVLLPVLGTGAVTAVEVSGSNLWVTQATAFKPTWLGAWMVLVDGAGVDLGGFRVQEVSGNRVLLTGASAVSGAATFRGEYRFDAVTVRNGARVVTPDRMVALDFEAKSGEMWLPSKTVVRNLTIRNGASVISAGQVLDLTVTELLTIDSGGLLSVTGKGYPGAATSGAQGGAPAGVTGPTTDTGGSHGGPGAAHDGGTPGAIYDSVYLPYQAGGGGSFENTPGGAGGGVLVAKVGELVLNGTIAARGDKRGYAYPNRGAAGAGGSIVIDAGIVRGSGLIDASGGDNDSCDWTAGSGGGGRVALYAGSLVSFAPETQIKSWGGGVYYCGGTSIWNNRYAGAGTVFVKTTSSTYGSLYVDSGTEANGAKRLGADVKLPELGTGTVTALEAAGADLWVTGSAAFSSAWIGSWMVLADAAGTDLGSFQVLRLDGSKALLGGAAAVTAAATYRGEYRFDSIAVRNDAKVVVPTPLTSQQLEVKLGEVRLPRLVKAQSVIVRPNAILGANENVLRLVVSGTLTVETGGKLTSTGNGYLGAATSGTAGGAPPLVTGATGDYGGSHGGVGTYHDGGTAGAMYGSLYFPTLPGGGGAFENTNGGAGGGAIDITADEVVVNGTIEARGAKRGYLYPYRGGAGGGGSVLIDTPLLRGTGLIDASGGDNESCDWWAGAGGGGRVALYADTLTGFDPATQARAWGGNIFYCASSNWNNRYGGAGTIYVRTSTATHGKLYAVQRPLTSVTTPTTLLPVVGTGNVGTVTTDTAVPADLWVEPQSPTALFPVGSVGLWLRIAGTDYRVLAEQPDRRHLLLQGAVGHVGTGDAYAGVYKLDAVTVNGQFTLQTSDVVEPGTVTLGGGAQFVHP